MGASRQGQVPDVLLELYLAGELPETERRRIEVARDESAKVRRRLEELKAEREAFLAAEAPAVFAHRLAARLAQALPAARPSRLWVFVAPVAALAAGLTGVVIFTRFGDERPPAGQPVLEAPAAPVAKPDARPAPTTGPLRDEGDAGRYAKRGRGRAAPEPKRRSADLHDKVGTLAEAAPRAEEGGGEAVGAGSEAFAARKKPEVVAGRSAVPSGGGAGKPAAGAREVVREWAAPPPPAGSAAAAAEAPLAVGRAEPVEVTVAGEAVALDLRVVWARCADVTTYPVQSVERQACGLRSCVETAIAAGELVHGQALTLKLTYRVRPDGGVERPRWDAPVGLRQTELAGCVLAKVKTWRLSVREVAVEQGAVWRLVP